MKNLILASLLLALSGCMNLYTRCPGTDAKIEDTYQCTSEMFSWSWVVAFPQTLAPERKGGLEWFNILTVPLGCIVFIDDCCEAACDTICYPFDNMRKNNLMEVR